MDALDQELRNEFLKIIKDNADKPYDQVINGAIKQYECLESDESEKARVFKVCRITREIAKKTKGQIVLVGHSMMFLQMTGKYLENCEFKGVDKVINEQIFKQVFFKMVETAK